MEQQNAPIFLRYGGAEKLTSEGGKVFAEWPDGRIEEIKAEG